MSSQDSAIRDSSAQGVAARGAVEFLPTGADTHSDTSVGSRPRLGYDPDSAKNGLSIKNLNNLVVVSRFT